MENNIQLLAVILCGTAAALSFIRHPMFRKLSTALWFLSMLASVFLNVLMLIFLLTGKFEYLYVYSHTSRNTDFIYRISSLWSGQEGSFLLWTFIAGIMGLFIPKIKSGNGNKPFQIYMIINSVILFMCYITKPFAKTGTLYSDGLGLNQALQDPWMVVHPPFVFIAYSALAVLFSLSIILSDKTDKNSLRCIRTWLLISWAFLGMGILSGSIWAYRALGWGGYWAWDPIENAALIPWLILCGFLHQREYRNKSVCLIPFLAAIFGVFLARSGILKEQSSHAYASGNIIITSVLVIVILGTLLSLVIINRKIRKINNIGVINEIQKKENTKNDIVAIKEIRKNKNINNAIGITKEIRKSNIKNDKLAERLVCGSMYGYAALIFLGTVIPVFTKIETPVTYYSAISVIFVLSESILLLINDITLLKKRYIFAMPLNTLLIVGIIVLTGSSKYLWLLILWICLMPFSLWIINGFRNKNWRYYLSHAGMLLLITGAVCSSGLTKKNAIIAEVTEAGFVTLEGMHIPVADLNNHELLIKVLPAKDILIEGSKIAALSQGKLMIPYTVKPMIMLFWIGGLLIILLPFVELVILWRKRHHATKKHLSLICPLSSRQVKYLN